MEISDDELEREYHRRKLRQLDGNEEPEEPNFLYIFPPLSNKLAWFFLILFWLVILWFFARPYIFGFR